MSHSTLRRKAERSDTIAIPIAATFAYLDAVHCIFFPNRGTRTLGVVAALSCTLMLGACSPADDPNRLDISIIGEPPRLADPDRDPLTISRSVIMRETAMGLVSLDASGQVQPALAESWILTDDGRSIIFRIQRMAWPNGDEVTGDEVAASLKRAIATNSENRLKPLLSAVDAVVGMTGRVVEIRLKVPRPYLLQLLAQPELGIRRNGAGLGPWRITGREAGAMVLRPAPDLAAQSLENAAEDARVVHLNGGRAALAIARFLEAESDLVLGGTLADWPIARLADLRDDVLRRDPVEGLFGFAVYPRTPFLKERALREALSMAIDREGLTNSFDAPRWLSADRLLPSQLDSGQPVALPPWSGVGIDDRQADARQRVAAWKAVHGDVEPLRLALPPGPGMRLLFARIASDWRTIGIRVVRVSLGSKNADLRLIDEIAPNTSANWYLTRTGCAYGLACSEAGDFALKDARMAPSLGKRSAALARADGQYATTFGYIPIAKPLRWSLVNPVLTRYRDNMFGAHPFDELRAAPGP